MTIIAVWIVDLRNPVRGDNLIIIDNSYTISQKNIKVHFYRPKPSLSLYD